MERKGHGEKLTSQINPSSWRVRRSHPPPPGYFLVVAVDFRQFVVNGNISSDYFIQRVRQPVNGTAKDNGSLCFGRIHHFDAELTDLSFRRCSSHSIHRIPNIIHL